MTINNLLNFESLDEQCECLVSFLLTLSNNLLKLNKEIYYRMEPF